MRLRNILSAIIIYGILTLLIFSPYLFFNKTFIPSDMQGWILPWAKNGEKIKNHYLTDVFGEHYPWKHLLKENMQKGIFPLWNSYNSFGIPQMAISTPTYYDVFNSLYLISSSVAIDSLIAALKVFLSGLFLFLLMRYYKVSFAGSLVSGLAFMLNGSFVNMHTFYWTIGAFLWLPLVILFLEKSLKEQSKRFVVAAGLFLGLSHLGGHLQTSLQVFLVLFLWICAKIYFSYRSKTHSPLKALVNLCFCYLISGLIAAVNFLPTIELIRLGFSRNYPMVEWFSNFFQNLLKIPFIISFFIPNFFGHHSILSIVSISGEKWTSYLMGYCGFVPLLLAIVAVIFIKNSKTKTYSFIALGTLAILFLSPLANVLYLRGLVVWCFAVSILAGFGLDYTLEAASKKFLKNLAKIFFGFFIFLFISLIAVQTIIYFFAKSLMPRIESYVVPRIAPVLGFVKDFYINKISATFDYYSISNIKLLIPLAIIGSFVFIIILFNRKKISKKSASVLVVLLVAVDLVYFFFLYIPIIDLAKYPLYPELDSTRFLAADKTLFRAMTLTEEGAEPPIYHFESNIPHKIQLVHHCGSINYIRPRKFRAEFNLSSPNFNPTVVNLVNVKYLFTKSIKLDTKKYPLVYSKEINIYRNPQVLPRAFTVSRFKVVSNPDNIIQAMKSLSFDPQKEVFLEEEPEGVLLDERLKKSEINIIKYDLNYVKLASDTDGNALLVFTDTNYPGWEAFIDGKETKVYNADYIFRSIYLPKGKHIVEFRFKPLSFIVGAWISIVSTFLCLVYILFNIKVKPKRLA